MSLRATATITAVLVDDERLAREELEFLLRDFGDVEVAGVAENGVQALEVIEKIDPDLVFLDVDMPLMNGFELCSKLRTGEMNKRTPVVFVTNMNDFENRANSTMSGGNDFIGKPFMFIELAVKALIHVLRGQLEPVKVKV